jgi:alkanesulfonate monooxygenase SsuD/methylene tetrahydromethanopterin reductase-like flavin-dependent oxidoreductase (luciferase family)
MGYNLMVVPYALPKPEMLADNLRSFHEARTAHGHNGAADILAVYHSYCGETAAKAKEEPRDAMLRYLGAVAESNREAAYSSQYAAYSNFQSGFKIMMDYDRALYPHRVIFGDPEQCVERIRQIEALGVTNVALLVNFGGLGREQVMSSLDRFGAEVMPRF